MSARINRRALTAGLLAATAAPAVAHNAGRSGISLRGDDTARLPDHAVFWARMPLPFTPAEAWHLLSPTTQAEIGAAVLGMALADYVSGDMHDEADHFHDDALRGDCMEDRLIAVLDRMDGDADREDDGDAEPSLAAPENHEGSQVVYMRGGDQDREAEAPETMLPEVVAECPEAIVLPWRGRGNVIAAVGVALLDMVGGR